MKTISLEIDELVFEETEDTLVIGKNPRNGYQYILTGAGEGTVPNREVKPVSADGTASVGE